MRTHQETETNWPALTMLSLASLVNGADLKAQDVNVENTEQIGAKTIDIIPTTQHDTIVTLDGARVRGSVATKNQDTVFVMTEDGNLTSIATAKILKLCITGESETVHSEIPSKISVMLDDGSLLSFSRVTFQEQKLNIGSGHNSTQVELRGELQLKIPLRGEYAWLHGQAHSTSIDKPQIIFRADGSVLMDLIY